MPLRGLMYFAELYQKHLTELPLETVLHLQEEISVGGMCRQVNAL